MFFVVHGKHDSLEYPVYCSLRLMCIISKRPQFIGFDYNVDNVNYNEITGSHVGLRVPADFKGS